jgi:hypothetical protein
MGMAGSPTPGLMQQAQQAQAMGAGASPVGRQPSAVDGQRATDDSCEARHTQGQTARIAKRRASLRRRHRVFAAKRAGRSRVACTDSRLACRMQPTHDVSCRPPGGTHVRYGLWPCAWGALRLIELGPTLLLSALNLSTVDFSTLRRPTSPYGAAASGHQPAATSQPVDLQSHPQNAAHRLRAAPGPDCARNIRLGLPMAYAARTKNPRPAAESGYVERMSTCRSRSLGRFPRNPQTWRHVGYLSPRRLLVPGRPLHIEHQGLHVTCHTRDIHIQAPCSMPHAGWRMGSRPNATRPARTTKHRSGSRQHTQAMGT